MYFLCKYRGIFFFVLSNFFNYFWCSDLRFIFVNGMGLDGICFVIMFKNFVNIVIGDL